MYEYSFTTLKNRFTDHMVYVYNIYLQLLDIVNKTTNNGVIVLEEVALGNVFVTLTTKNYFGFTE